MTHRALPAEQQARIEAAVRVAAAWQETDHPARVEAIEATLEAPNRFTEQALAFALNQQMDQLTAEALDEWIGGLWTDAPRTVGVLNAGDVPLDGLVELLGVLLSGHAYLGTRPSTSPHLLPAFVDEMRRFCASLPAQFVEEEVLFQRAEAVIARGDDDVLASVRAQCTAHEIARDHCLLRGGAYSVAVIDGNENKEEREGLARDALLHEGQGRNRAAIIWAPRDLEPDPYLDAFARFRGVFPVHPELPGALQMPQAFLEATDQSHAYGEGLEFLVSRGEPEPQQPGHTRWTEYDTLETVATWLDAHEDEILLVVARPDVAERLATEQPLAPPGAAQQPALDTPSNDELLAFLATLSDDG